MFESNEKNRVSELANTMAFIFAYLTSEFMFSKLDFTYAIFTESFDLLSFLIKLVTLFCFYHVWLKFFKWLYPKEK
ncbi:hypothetical protein [Colwellia sp. 20A7]|uniref:hypothetical protein n=1 Tax=Colwellia sp. 20A7 TaxID=2689569 RepID=UPI0013572F0E|nr:hypothetical protein [Colwellia sp. 20A7]